MLKLNKIYNEDCLDISDIEQELYDIAYNRIPCKKVFGSGISHIKKERIKGEVSVIKMLNPFTGEREPWYFIDGVRVDSKTIIIKQ